MPDAERREIAEDQAGVGRTDRANASQQRPDASGELLRGEGFGEVVVGSGLETGHDIVRVVSRRHHHDRHVAVASQRAAQLETVHAGKHDVDQDDIRQASMKKVDRLFAASGFIDGPALVLESQLHRRTYALVVFYRKDAGSHGSHDARIAARFRACQQFDHLIEQRRIAG